ncbi:MAG: hypothetical protein KME60_26105 [Cyanomargarita calcarea GSE-NOS-MK-12-04C]|jgi:hypothetical protein|uniref:Uncharacterized protein n=1 Tax=Cyanomargarita calcarea GSE-NOS-MK-12-04C TaxID=2839659 RepID=A0A951QSF7_9CYAN|nr:hypothetical protein [Cyanomargarita calcarea GSE-NOS-MK-12-04C]
MTDFLTTLAARTLGLPPVIQPMISSIFSSGLVVFGDYGSGEMGGEREYKESSSLYQFSSPNLPAISRLPLSQISTPASEFNNIEFNDEMGKMPRQPNIEPIVESANASTNELSESLPVQRFSEVEVKGSSLEKFATSEIQNMPTMQGNYYETSPTSEQQELPKKSSQSNPDIPDGTLTFATPPQPTEKTESQSPTIWTSNQLAQPSSAKTILPLTQFEPLVNQVQPSEIKVEISKQLENISTESTSTVPKSTSNQENQQNITKSVPSLINQLKLDEIPVEISKQLENTSPITKPTISKENQRNINKLILPLSSSQTITPRLVEPLINQIQPDEVPVQISKQLENISDESTSTVPKSTSNQENQQNINKSILPLTSSQTITPRLVEPLIISLGLSQKLPETLIDITAKTPLTRSGFRFGSTLSPLALPFAERAEGKARNNSLREFFHKSYNQVKIDEVAVQTRGQKTLIETLIDSAIPVSSSNEVGKLDKEIKAKEVDTSKVKLSSSLSFPVSTPSKNVSTLQPSQSFTNVNIVVVKPLVDRRMNANRQEQETSLKSANLSEYLLQYATSKNQSVVLPQQLSVYSQFHTQMESRESGQTDRRGEGVTMEQAPTKTIQVTIGRIEVRCNQTASQTKHTKPNRSEPKLSLQDYLKKRQGGNS